MIVFLHGKRYKLTSILFPNPRDWLFGLLVYGLCSNHGYHLYNSLTEEGFEHF